MGYKVEYNWSDNEVETWNPVIDMNLSKTKPVVRLFLSEEQAQNYIDQEGADKKDKYRIVEVE